MDLSIWHERISEVPRYQLQLRDIDGGKTQEFEFDGNDPHAAFSIMERSGGSKSATLWDCSKCLGTLRYSQAKIWELSSVDVGDTRASRMSRFRGS